MNKSGYPRTLTLPHPCPPGYIPVIVTMAGNGPAGSHRSPQGCSPAEWDGPDDLCVVSRVETFAAKDSEAVMTQGRGRTWGRRVVIGGILALIAGGVWGGLHANEIQVRYAAHRLETATTDEERAEWAGVLTARGDTGWQTLTGFVRSSNPPTQAAAVAAIDRYLNDLPDSDPQGAVRCEQLLDAFAAADESGREIVLSLLPTLVKRGGVANAAKCHDVVAAGLQMPGVGSRLAAIRAAMHPHVRLRQAILPLLHAAEPEVRRTALFAVGPATDDDPVIGDEELFHWLHDPDNGVRKVCQDSLVSRGRTDAEITLGRRLTDPSAAERLKLLLDLSEDDDISDPEPWLERLSRDTEPGVRAGAARVAVEIATVRRLNMPVWVGRLAESDPDPTVRRIVRLHKTLPHFQVDEATRWIGGP